MKAPELDLDLYSHAFRSRLEKSELVIGTYGRRYIVTVRNPDTGYLELRENPDVGMDSMLVWDGHAREIVAVLHNDGRR